ncbi:MAG: GDSL-type esterase/lipase family protein [Dysgonamonadaceae bacterium]|jgi:beta-galactosidase|nr:GDSL-type esterase/lipase family protein [Dysgonamonadaceae bacterium]
MNRFIRVQILIAAALLTAIFSLNAQGQRTTENFDFDWKFIIADRTDFSEPAYDDYSWQDVQLPHDWNITMKFSREAKGENAFLPGSTGWYRKTFTVPASAKDSKIYILFDGIFHQSDVYINGRHLGFRPYGFCSIEYDLTPFLNFGGQNVIAVRVDCTGERARWYAGSGIYRHVWLKTLNPVHIANYGISITTPEVSVEKAEIRVVTKVENTTSKLQNVMVSHKIFYKKGADIIYPLSVNGAVEADSSTYLTKTLSLHKPMLWDVDNPALYTLETTVAVGGKIVDCVQTRFGVRTFAFDADKGFSLNGKPLKLKGMCLHPDAGSLGVAVPDRSYERRLEILKEYGCNAIRCAHNQPSPEFLDLCDRMGFLVIDEAFDKWKSGYYAKYFDEWWQRDLEDMLLRDRNHPSVVLWSIGNEVQEAWNDNDEGVQRAAMLQDFVHKIEPTRPVALAAQIGHKDKFAGVTDVVGYNYLEARMLSDHKKYPSRRFVITEELPYYCGTEANIRAYETNNPWNIIEENDFIAGGFIWPGVDYLGESNWPSKGWPNGLFDICMTEKPRAAFLRAKWNDKPLVSLAVADNALNIEAGNDLWQWPRIAKIWNFPDNNNGLIMDVQAITNCDSVELFLNGKSYGRRSTGDFPNNTVIWKAPYYKGKLTAVGYRKGVEVARDSIITSQNTEYPVFTPDRTVINADGQDLSHIMVELRDKAGNPVQTDDRRLTVSVEGAGRLLGIDNGDLRRENSFSGNSLKTYFGKALITIQSQRRTGTIAVKVSMEGSDSIYTTEITAGKGIFIPKAASQAKKQSQPWVGTWATAPQLVEPGNMPPAPGLSGNTLRQTVRVSIGGERLRIRFSNAFSTQATVIKSATIAIAKEGCEIEENSKKTLYFTENKGITILPHSEVWSDALDFHLPADALLSITTEFGEVSPDLTGHPGSRTTSYILAGNNLKTPDFGRAAKTDHWYIIQAIEVETSGKSAAIAVLGNSITDGRGSGTNRQNRWTDVLSQRLLNNKGTKDIGVLNLGIGGNCVLRGGLGPTALDRFDSDILSQAGVRWLIILEGVNDLGGVRSDEQAEKTVGELIAAYQTFIEKAHARGIKVFGCTILPFGGSFYDNPFSQKAWTQVNEWIRTSDKFDAVIDFAETMRSAESSAVINQALHDGDNLHPNEAGYRRMGEAVDLRLFGN